MSKPNVTTSEMARCLEILRSATEPMVAAGIAARIYLAGKRETQRRHVRAIVKALRESGSMIVATLQGGYYLTEDETMWRKYLDGRQIDAKSILKETHRKKKVLAEANGQELLFDNRIVGGSATIGAAQGL